MKAAAVFLLDLHPAGSLAGRLGRILESIPAVQTHVFHTHESVNPQSAADLNRALADVKPGAIFIFWPPDRTADACRMLPYLKIAAPGSRVVAVTEGDDQQGILEVLKVGVDDVVTLKRDPSTTLPKVLSLLSPPNEEHQLVSSLKHIFWLRNLIGQSPGFIEEIKSIPLLARCNATVLITGETGTGKELCARAIHYLSARTGKPFVGVNCGAIPVDLVENELFGHERGAYTGAVSSQIGLVAEAEGGTLLLDEIDSLPLLAQVKLLRFLQEKEYRPLGASRMRRADVRLLAATNSNLEDALQTGRLREDLYYRLSVMALRMPPLRERREDIPLLANHFLKKYAQEFEKEVLEFSPEALSALMAHHWAGNVRELEHVIERAAVFASGKTVNVQDIRISGLAVQPGEQSLQQAKAGVVARFEKSYIQGLLRAYKGNITRAAEAAKKNRRAFFQLIRKHGIDVAKFKKTT